MLHTYLTTSWHLRYPIIGAPMAYVGRGRLAHAVSQAGGLGMIGIGSAESVDFLAREAAIARGRDEGRFGIGMHVWAIERRPDLLAAAIEAKPFLISLSFGSPAPYVERLHQHGIVLATQVNTRATSRSRSHRGAGDGSRRTRHGSGEYASSFASRAGRDAGACTRRGRHRNSTRDGCSPGCRCRRGLDWNRFAGLS